MCSIFLYKMIAKFVLLTLVAVCQGGCFARSRAPLVWLRILTVLFVQADSGEPWWIQMFFPNVRFTGKYHPSNYKVEKSPLFPDYVQNPNDVWSPAYWMPYKQAYAQYWIDLIENSTKPEEEMNQQNQAQAGNQYEAGGYYQQSGQYGQEDIIAEEASNLAQQVQTQAQNMNAGVQQIVSQVQEDAEKQKEAVMNEANHGKEKIAEELGRDSSQAQAIAAQVDRVVEEKVEAIDQQVVQFEEDVKRWFAPLNEKAQEIAMEAAQIVKEVHSQ